MPKTFFPEIHKLVPASSPHPPNTHYKVSIGLEDWEGNYVPVAKVQMVYNGIVAGRKSPSYPIGSNDYNTVIDTIKDLISQKTNLRNRS